MICNSDDMQQRWRKSELNDSESGKTVHVWESLKTPGLTVNAAPLGRSEDQDERGRWREVMSDAYYVYPAFRGRGTISSPYMAEDEREGIRKAESLLKMDDISLMRGDKGGIGRISWPHL